MPLEQKFTVKRINGFWTVEGDCVDTEFPDTIEKIHKLLDVSVEQMLHDEGAKRG